jgi:hypothetical protein
MATTLPFITFNVNNLGQLAPMLTTNAEATNRALGERVVGHRASVTRYAATGATTNKIPVGSTSPQGSTPYGVLLVRVRETSDPGKDLSVVTRLNFTQDTGTLYVYEPSGLTANTFYDLDFLVLE